MVIKKRINIQNRLKAVENGQQGTKKKVYKRVRTVKKNQSKWSKMIQNNQRWLKLSKTVKMVKKKKVKIIFKKR